MKHLISILACLFCLCTSFTIFAQQKGTVTDFDGNVYQTVIIGDQEWMAENLMTTHYADGTAIPLVVGDSEWADLGDNDTDAAYCAYENSSDTELYGFLYPYAAAVNACPDNWQLPTTSDWQQLYDYIANDGMKIWLEQH